MGADVGPPAAGGRAGARLTPADAADFESPTLWAWAGTARARFVGGNRVQLLQGGDDLFPALTAAIDGAVREVWLATYIFDTDAAAASVADALMAAARRGVAVHVVVDGFGSLGTLLQLRKWFAGSGVRFEVFRSLDRWWAWLQPSQLRRLHQKLCVVDRQLAFVGGINIIDDRHDQTHGVTDQPRLDFAVALNGPLALQVHETARAMWSRAHLGHAWSSEPLPETLRLLRTLRTRRQKPPPPQMAGVRAAFVVRDNFRQRRAIERVVLDAVRSARTRVDIAVPYFYPGHGFLRELRRAARQGVCVRLLLQGKVDYRIAALAARVLYDELRAHRVRIFEYTPAFLHAKVVVVDDDWATVGSSNIDPLSLLLNLEANVVVRDRSFASALTARLDAAIAQSTEIVASAVLPGWRTWLRRGLVAWCANVYLRVAGITGRY